jgi:hypothetical protein
LIVKLIAAPAVGAQAAVVGIGIDHSPAAFTVVEPQLRPPMHASTRAPDCRPLPYTVAGGVCALTVPADVALTMVNTSAATAATSPRARPLLKVMQFSP